SALDVDQRNVLVAGGDGGRDGLEPVGDGDDDIGAEIVEGSRRLHHADSGGLGARQKALALKDRRYAPAWREAVALDHRLDPAIALEQRRGGEHDLQLDVVAVAQRLKRRADPRIARPRRDDD